MKRFVVPIVLLLAATVASACGDDASGTSIEGEAALAVSQFWVQERDGGILPEGQDVIERGAYAIVELDPGDQDGRACVEYVYTVSVAPFTTIRRVYIATKANDEWTVVVERPDGTCEGVV